MSHQRLDDLLQNESDVDEDEQQHPHSHSTDAYRREISYVTQLEQAYQRTLNRQARAERELEELRINYENELHQAIFTGGNQTQLNNSQPEHDMSENSLKELRDAQYYKALMESRQRGMQEEIDELHRSLHAVQHNLRVLEEENQKLRHDRKAHIEEIHVAREEFEKLIVAHEQLKTNHSEVLVKLDKIQQDFDEERQDLQAKYDAVLKEKKSLANKYNDAFENLQERQARLDVERRQYELMLDHLEQQRDMLGLDGYYEFKPAFNQDIDTSLSHSRHGHDASITGHEENIYGFSNDSQHATVPLVKDIAKYGSFGSDMDIIDCQRYAEKLVTAAFELCQHYDRAQRAFINKDPILHPYLLKELSSLENQYRHIEGVYAAVTKEYEKLSNRLVEENPDLKTAFLPLPFLSRLPDRIAFIEQNDKRMEPDPSNSETDRQEIEDSKYLTNTEEDYVSNQRHSPAASYILEHEPVRGGNNFKPSSNSHSNSTRANNGKNYDDCFSNDGNLLPHSDQTKQDERTEPLCLEEFNRFRPDVLNVVRRPLSGNVRFGSFDTVYEISPLHYPGMYSSIPFELRPCHQQSSKSSQLSPHSSSQVPIDHMIKANCQEKVDPISQKEKISRQPSRSTSIGEEKLGTIDHSKREEQQKLKKVLAAEDKQEKRETKLDETILCSRKFNLCDCVYDKKTNATSDDGDDENAASSNSSYNEENFQAHSSEHQEQSKLGLSKYLNMPTSDTLDETRLTHYNKRRSHKRRLQSISNEEGEQENGHQENNKVGDSKEADIDKRDNIHQRYLSAEGDMDDNTNSEEFSSIAISNPTKSDIIYQMRLQSEPGKAQVTGKDQNFDSTNNDGSGTDDGNDAHDSDSFKSDGTNYNGEEDFQDLKHPAKDQLFCSRQNAQPLVKKSFVRVNKHMNENVTSHKQHDVARSHFNHRAKSIERLNESRKSLQQVVRESQERSLLTAASLRPRSYENRGIDYPCYYRDYSNFDMSFDFKRSIFKDLVNERSFNGSWNDQPRSTVPKPFLLNEHRLHKNPSSSPSLGLSFHDSTESPMARNEDEKAEMRVGRKQQAENEEKDDKLCTDRQADFVTSTPTEHKRQRKFSQAKSTKFITFDSIIAADSVKSSHQCEHSISPAPNGDRYLRASSRSSSSDSFRCYDSSQNRNSQDDSQGDTLSQKNEILFQHGKASAQPSSGDNIQLGSGNTPNDMRNYATKSKLKKPSTEDNSEQSELSASESLIFQSHLFSNHDSQDEDDVTCDPFYNLSQSLDRATDAARKLNLSASQLSTASVD